jgi:hypothetical protein
MRTRKALCSSSSLRGTPSAKLAPGPPPGRAELDDEAPGEVLRLYLAPLFSAYPIPKVGPLGHARDGTTPKVGFPLFGETNPMCA